MVWKRAMSAALVEPDGLKSYWSSKICEIEGLGMVLLKLEWFLLLPD